MKRFPKAILWYRNPKAGFLFAILSLTVLGTIVIPAAVYVVFLRPGSQHVSQTGISFSVQFLNVVFLFAMYCMALQWLYLEHLIRRIFMWPKIVASIASIVAVSPVILPVALLICASKLKGRKSFFRGTGALLATLSILILAFLPAMVLRPWLVEVCAIASVAFIIGAVVAMPDTYRVGKWAFIPVVLLVCAWIGIETAASATARRADRLEKEVIAMSGVEWSRQDVVNYYAAGIPITNEPYATLYSETEGLPSVPNVFTNSIYGSISDEERGTFNAFATSNKTLIVEIDRITDQPGYRPGFTPVGMDDFRTPPPALVWLNWGKFYARKMLLASHDGDMETGFDCGRRLDNIRTWAVAPNAYVAGLVASGMEGNLRRGFRAVATRLSETELADLQERFETYAKSERERLRRCMINEVAVFHETCADINARVGRMSSPAYSRILSQVYAVWMNCERFNYLCYVRGFLEETERMTEENYTVDYDYDSLHLLLSRWLAYPLLPVSKIRRNMDDNKLMVAGIAVERYRRKYGRLPETLDVLVPEFLNGVPLSWVDGKPFTYEYGTIGIPQPGWEKEPFIFEGYKVAARPSNSRMPWVYPVFAVPLQDAGSATE